MPPKTGTRGSAKKQKRGKKTNPPSAPSEGSKRPRTDTDTEPDDVPVQKKNKAVTVEEITDDDDETEEQELGELTHLGQNDPPLNTGTERLSKKWTSAIYAFYHPVPTIETVDGRRCHVFACAKKTCKYLCRRYLDKADSNSTSNLRKHTRSCWGPEVLTAAENAGSLDEARTKVVKALNLSGSITAVFERTGKGKATYSNRQHTKVETRTELVRWVSESLRPFRIVQDRGFNCLMKTGRPDYYLPSAMTVCRDVKTVFARTRSRIAKMLRVCIITCSSWIQNTHFGKEYEGKLSFATDCWTSPNHRAFMAITVHLEVDGKPLCLLLDAVEIARSHTGTALAGEFARILEEFGIAHKVSAYYQAKPFE